MSIAPAELASLVGRIVRQAREADVPEADEVASIAGLLSAEPRNADHVVAIVAVIVRDAVDDPFRETTANRWRAVLPGWVRPAMVGATVNRLRAAGLLVATGRHVRCTDVASRNAGKLQPVYALDLGALPDDADTAAVEAS